MRSSCVLVTGVVLACSVSWAQRPQPRSLVRRTVTRSDCSFQSNPDHFLAHESRLNAELHERSQRYNRMYRFATASKAIQPFAGTPRNFIDREIFGKLKEAGVAPSMLSSDDEFLRRIYLDLTGMPPDSSMVRIFLADKSTNKRDTIIERLLESPEFVDRWTVWLSDLVGVTAYATNVARFSKGRDSFYFYVRDAVEEAKPLNQFTVELVTGTGNNFERIAGPSNFPVGADVGNGPDQDKYDLMLAKTATAFLGMASYDCLVCHSGRGHTTRVNVWATKQTRSDGWHMASFFSRMRLDIPNPTADVYNYVVSNSGYGSYMLDTTDGNRPRRLPADGNPVEVTPIYRDGSAPASDNWRQEFANKMVQDPMFRLNWANRFFAYFFGRGIMEPIDSLDPERLNPAFEPTKYQRDNGLTKPVHLQLLLRLGDKLQRLNYDMRGFIRVIVQSNAYQLSSLYDRPLRLNDLALYPRHVVKRLDAEQMHDSVAKATGQPAQYYPDGWKMPVQWAHQLPEVLEPYSDYIGYSFLSPFFRGNRDTQKRSQASSVLQSLTMLNSRFLVSRVEGVTALPFVTDRASNDQALVEEIFIRVLSRRPTPDENAAAVAALHGPAGRDVATRDLFWALFNTQEFAFVP